MALIKEKKKRRTGRATLAIKGSKHEPMSGHELRLKSFVKRAAELKRKDYWHSEIAEIIAEEYQLVSVPGIATIADWLKKADQAMQADIVELQLQLRMQQYSDLDKLKRKWMIIATADELEIRRWKMVEGELQPELDEKAIAEQLKASEVIIKIMTQQAKLLGLNMEAALASSGDGPASLQELQLWMIGQVNIQNGPHGAAIDVASQVLELKSGLPEIDNREEEDGV